MNNKDRYAVVGHPVAHSRSPFIHARFAEQTHQPLEYGTIDAAPASSSRWCGHFFAAGGKGLNVTVPHKEAAFRLAAELTPRAQRAQAVNTLSLAKNGQLLGDNTDGTGLARDLLNNQRIAIAGPAPAAAGCRRRRARRAGAADGPAPQPAHHRESHAAARR